jgi:hypothetical protein
VLIYPNPVNPGYTDVKLKITITQPASEAKIRIYTAAFRRIMEMELGAQDTKEITVTIPKERINRLAAGAYFVVVTGKSIGKEKAASKPEQLLILR